MTHKRSSMPLRDGGHALAAARIARAPLHRSRHRHVGSLRFAALMVSIFFTALLLTFRSDATPTPPSEVAVRASTNCPVTVQAGPSESIKKARERQANQRLATISRSWTRQRRERALMLVQSATPAGSCRQLARHDVGVREAF